ncbi:hypothetical protein PPSIR1_09870 [Plesiocystis pacifica SIR-1]|uniref:Uncharacterized protein n=1 Tax=Plesiocystis pacifica SIR-1 TaxID=391625 RepID=A6G9T4_9BACT|nr:hypothetical protein [Plesiocystis pacifica]EDM77370.1 hypothetical protein PPSIR1_09870 [Plesiocystis pacifica SIR-1]
MRSQASPFPTSGRLARVSIPAFVAAIGLSTGPAAAGPTAPDYCDELDEFGHPRYCEPTAPGRGPWWGEELCCDQGRCAEVPVGGCGALSLVYCELAELASDGNVTCVYEAPSYCEVFGCAGDYDEGSELGEEYAMCCHGMDQCYMLAGPCGGSVVWCHDGVSNEDGTYSCLEGNVL